MHKSKKNKSETVVKTEIKTEKEDLKPLTAYLDDRVELIKQTFSALKPKTILSLAPDFMKKLDIAEIEELCLNELLGISTKRLISIINATECPSDTESTTDSDVENVEECISLEEISSDSDVAPANNRGGRSRRKRKNLEQQKQTEAPKEVSVLELLELQARARAIRSQLALEPVTKIEVDSDDSSSSGEKSSKVQPKRTKKSPPKSSAAKSQSKEKNSSTIPNGHCEQKAENAPKPVKLKRNFRKHCQDDDSDESENAPKESRPPAESSAVEKTAPSLTSKEVSPRKEIKKEESVEKQRSLSPDIITILQSPETLCISDSSDNDEDESKKKNQTECKEIEDSNETSQNPSDLNGQPEEDKEKESPDVNESEIEDGEILDHEEEIQKEPLELEADGQQETEPESKEAPADEEKRVSDVDADDEGNSSKANENSAKEISEHQIDDVISLEHEELDYETRDQIEEEANSKSKSGTNSPQKNQNSCDDNNSDSKNDDAIDCIELHDDDSSLEGDIRAKVSTKSSIRDDQKTDDLSWSSRWLQSSKVSKILMTSKLGNRVRDKIKKSKRIESEQIIDDNSSGSNKDASIVYESKFAEGSTHQYHELGSMSKEK